MRSDLGTGLLAAATVLLTAETASAGDELVPAVPAPMTPPPVKAEPDPTFAPLSPVRRNGVMLGAAGGIAFAGASGYPNNPRLENDPNSFSASPLLVGWSSSFFLLGALTDWISFGPMFTLATFESSDWKSTGFGIGFRAETYPFLRIVPALADLSVYGMAGVGSASLRAKGPYPTSDGTSSYFGGGIHHEWRLGTLLGGHGAAGPYVEYDAMTSIPTERHMLSGGIRVVWYGGHVQLDGT